MDNTIDDKVCPIKIGLLSLALVGNGVAIGHVSDKLNPKPQEPAYSFHLDKLSHETPSHYYINAHYNF